MNKEYDKDVAAKTLPFLKCFLSIMLTRMGQIKQLNYIMPPNHGYCQHKGINCTIWEKRERLASPVIHHKCIYPLPRQQLMIVFIFNQSIHLCESCTLSYMSSTAARVGVRPFDLQLKMVPMMLSYLQSWAQLNSQLWNNKTNKQKTKTKK